MSKIIHMKVDPKKFTKVDGKNPDVKVINIRSYVSDEAMAAFRALSDHLV